MSKRIELRGIVERIKADAEDLQVAADVALQNWLVLDAAANGTEDEVAAAMRVIASDFPELLPS